MTIHLIKKEKGRVYKSEAIVRALFGIELCHAGDGAPFLLCEDAAEKRFISISDTKNYWACAMSGRPLGLDMEEAGRVIKPAVVKRLHKDEQAYLAVLSEGSSEWTEEFLSIWTRKEAWAKYSGKGLAIGFAGFSVLGGAQPAPEQAGAAQIDASAPDRAECGSPSAFQPGCLVPLVSFKYKNLIFGLAGEESADVVMTLYDAPMEQSALDYAAGLLDSRAYPSAALRKKLEDRGYTAEEISQAVEKLKDYGYVNDVSFAEELARRAAESGKGSRRISFELREKGIDKDLAGQTASEYREGEYARALDIARKMSEKSGRTGRAPVFLPEQSDSEDFSCQPDPADLSSEEKKELRSQRQKLAAKISRKLSSFGYDAPVIYSVLEDLGL